MYVTRMLYFVMNIKSSGLTVRPRRPFGSIHMKHISTLIYRIFWMVMFLTYHASPNFVCPAACQCQGTQVDCSQRNLDSVPDDLHLDTTRLDMHGNDLKRIHTGFIGTMPQLVWLDLSSNNIEELQHAFSGLFSLRHLDLSNNNLIHISRDILGRLPLKTLDLSHNSGLQLPQAFFQDLELRMLTLRHADLASLTFLHNASIDSLDLSHNLLGQEVWAALPRMRQIIEVNLEDIGLYDINMTSPIPTLQKLYLPHNHISNLYTRNLHNINNLTFLDVSDNQITTLPLDLDESLRNLSILNISHNRLHSIQAESINAMPLMYLSLYGNRITNLSAAFRPVLSIPGTNDSNNLELDLRGNPLRCNCDLLWLKHWLSLQSNNTLGNAECSVPQSLQLSQMEAEDMQCTPPNITDFRHSWTTSETGTALLVFCSASGEPPPLLTMSTSNDDVYTQPPSLTEPETVTPLQLTRVYPNCSDIGSYTCGANNGHGSVSIVIKIEDTTNYSVECPLPTQIPTEPVNLPMESMDHTRVSTAAVVAIVVLLFIVVVVIIAIFIYAYWRSSGHYNVAKKKAAYNDKKVAYTNNAYKVDIATISWGERKRSFVFHRNGKVFMLVFFHHWRNRNSNRLSSYQWWK